ncbi:MULTISPECIES: adenylate cyclase regulatory domain-containing protein [Mycobacteriaceae]|uniref:adenylate cyclase regulatory domain-containing protein n=1 Tax=Mycobacteriaceae TaxID=1762 RepID=UPI000991FBC2|nr:MULTISPECIES: adenylate cyclase regulatory domain-containing protein [Mycobacteriaceae]MBN7330981.1 hypothetical protein [Mycobacteroides abscessus subsp. abscessus]UXA15166.1 hypothetical protein KXD97_04620 [Mycobacterium sp. SMC-8]
MNHPVRVPVRRSTKQVQGVSNTRRRPRSVCLHDGLEGDSRQERTHLIAWLHAQGFTIDQSRLVAPTPLLLPTSRVLGDEGRYVSLRELSTETGIQTKQSPYCGPSRKASGRPRR